MLCPSLFGSGQEPEGGRNETLTLRSCTGGVSTVLVRGGTVSGVSTPRGPRPGPDVLHGGGGVSVVFSRVEPTPRMGGGTSGADGPSREGEGRP